MNNPIISVIIPCYGVLWNINEIFNDIINQTFHDIEIIFINDGDKTLSSTLNELKKHDNRVHVIEKDNGGVSSARNIGIKASQGKYIVFVDPDDRLDKNYLQILYDSVKDGHTQLGIAGFIKLYKKENIIENNDIKVESFTSNDFKNVYFKLGDLIKKVPWNKIYDANFIKQNSLYFNEKISYTEDAFFNQAVYSKSPNIKLIKNCGYTYVMQDNNSLCSKYKKNYTECELKYIFNECQLLKDFGYSDEIIKNYRNDSLGLHCYFLVCNYFKKGSPYSFAESIKGIKNDLLNNSVLMEAYNVWKNKKCNNFIKIFHLAMKTKSAFCIALLFKIQYIIKYNFYNIYLHTKPWLKS